MRGLTRCFSVFVLFLMSFLNNGIITDTCLAIKSKNLQVLGLLSQLHLSNDLSKEKFVDINNILSEINSSTRNLSQRMLQAKYGTDPYIPSEEEFLRICNISPIGPRPAAHMVARSMVYTKFVPLPTRMLQATSQRNRAVVVWISSILSWFWDRYDSGGLPRIWNLSGSINLVEYVKEG